MQIGSYDVIWFYVNEGHWGSLKAVAPLQRAIFYKKLDTFKSNQPSEDDVKSKIKTANVMMQYSFSWYFGFGSQNRS